MEFQNAMNSSVEYFINLNPRSPEFISLFVDDKLRKAELVIEEDDQVIVLDNVAILVCYLQDKVYEDIKPADEPRLGVHVLSTGSWSSQLTRTTTCNLPPEIIRMSEKFGTYYLGIHKRRKLNGKQTWEPISTHIDEDDVFTVNEMFSSKCYKVKVGNGTVGVANMESEPEKQETLQTMQKDRKQQIDALISNMTGSGTEAAHKEQDPGKLMMVQNLEVGRKPQIDALILKITKANGIMDCNNLVREVTKQLQSRIRTNPAIIKRIITLLTDCGNLQRDTKDGNLLRCSA
ncbi:cullin 3 [Tanacetum coccineum]